MATATDVINTVAAAVSVIAPHIPAVVQLMENVFGHSANTGTKDGAPKLQGAVNVATSLLADLASAGKIQPGVVADPNTPAAIAGAVQQAVNTIKAAGGLSDSSATAYAGASTTAPKAAVTAGQQLTVSGTLQIK